MQLCDNTNDVFAISGFCFYFFFQMTESREKITTTIRIKYVSIINSVGFRMSVQKAISSMNAECVLA